MKHVKDPIHGYIDIPSEELSIINTPEFQRLRRIKQLGLSDTVYPSATHTRFSHSLGVMYLAGELAKSVDVSEYTIRANKVAGLLHDIGHLPFSHTIEHLLEERTGMTHEDISCNYIDDLKRRDNVTFPVDTTDIKSIINGENNIVNTVSSDIDADRLDYLVRDSYHTGINFGKIESDTLMKFAQLIDGLVGFDHKSLKSVERLLDARMQMNYSVYSHDTVAITETMLTRSVEQYLDNTSVTILDLIGKDDSELGYELKRTDVNPAKELFLNIQNRNLYKTSFLAPLQNVTSEKVKYISEFFSQPQIHEERIAEIAGLDKTKVLIDPPNYTENEEFNIPIRTSLGTIECLEDISPKPNALRESSKIHENLHVFCPEEHIETVHMATKDYIGTIDKINDLNIQ
jgi:HD superfamily phosphohydrolase